MSERNPGIVYRQGGGSPRIARRVVFRPSAPADNEERTALYIDNIRLANETERSPLQNHLWLSELDGARHERNERPKLK